MKGQRKKKARIAEIDRISGLPDSILSHILSFLDTKSAVRSSVLSKRWRLVWTSLPSLDFRYGPVPLCEKTPQNTTSFTSFINHVLALRDNSHIITFRFSVHYDVDPSLIEDCIDYALTHNVQQLKIRSFSNQRPVKLPAQLFTSLSLSVLKLTCATSTSMSLPSTLSLPCLKSLHLKNFAFSDQNYNGEMVIGCPNLESLVLCKCGIRPRNKLKVMHVLGNQLRNLEILYWRCPWAYLFDHSIVVSSPRLVSFKYEGHVSPVRFEDDLHCLDKVCIDLCWPTSCSSVDVDERKLRSGECLISMLGELSNVKSLTLSLKTIEILSSVPNLQASGPSTFGNLRYLRFNSEDKCTEMNVSIDAMTNLLKSADGGKNLTLDLPVENKHSPCVDLKCPKEKDGHNPVDMINIPVNVMSYLLWSSPCAESLIVEFPEESSGEK